MRKVIVNSTPLIALSNVDKLEVLKMMYGEITIPRAVYEEISVKPDSICKKMVEEARDWINVEDIENEMAKLMFKPQLHDGEVEVMILAMEKKADLVIIDDSNARKYAKYLELTLTGTIGVLIKAKQKGYVSEIRPLIDGLSRSGLYLSKTLIEKCLEQVGEV